MVEAWIEKVGVLGVTPSALQMAQGVRIALLNSLTVSLRLIAVPAATVVVGLLVAPPPSRAAKPVATPGAQLVVQLGVLRSTRPCRRR